MPSKYFVTSIGNAIIDVLAFVGDNFLEKNRLNKGSMSLLDQKNAVLFSDLKYEKICSGGSAANTTVTMSNFGVKNAFIGNVGSGHYGTLFQEDLQKNGVDFYCKNKTKFGSTARSFILITPDGERTMCTYLGEASNIVNEIDSDAIANSDLLYLEGYLWDQPQIIKALKKAMIIAKNNNTKIAFTLSDSFWVKNHHKDFLKLTSVVDLVFANEDEIKALIQSDKLDAGKIKQLGQNNDKLVIVITRSAKGAIIFDASKQEFYKVPCNPVEKVVDATGAGDAFAAGFMYGINHGLNLEDCAKVGHLFATNVIQKVGGRLDEKEINSITEILKSASINVG